MYRYGYISDTVLKKIKEIIITNIKVRLTHRSVIKGYYT